MTAAEKLSKAKFKMSCAEFYEAIAVDEIDGVIQDLYWDGGFSADDLFLALRRLAAKVGVELTDADDWEFERFFWEVWKSAEKGLS